MIRPFAQFYDVIYGDKDYNYDISVYGKLVGDSDWRSQTILEIGTGTGNQALILAPLVNHIFCCETDADFLAIFKNKIAAGLLRNVTVLEGPIELAQELKCDTSVAFFHVINYVGPKDLGRFLNGLARRMKPGAPFVADLWQAEAVYLSPPKSETRRKVIHGSEVEIEIIPVFNSDNSTVTLQYKIELIHMGKVVRFEESLNLYLWTREELAWHFSRSGFVDLQFWDYRHYPQPATEDSWKMWLRCYRS